MAVLDLQVGAGADDTRHWKDLAEVHSWSGTTPNWVIGNNNAGGTRKFGVSSLFTNATISQAATIDVSYKTLTSNTTISTAVCKAKIDAEDVDSGDAPISDADWDNEVRTTAIVTWDPVPAMVIDGEYNTPSIITVIQELVDRAGWASGNNMNLFVHDDDGLSDVDAIRLGYSYDGNTTKAPKLHIEYTAGAATRPNEGSLALLGAGR